MDAPQKAHELAALGVRVRRGDFCEPNTLLDAFEKASNLLIVSSNASAYGGDPLSQHRSAIEAARVVGVERIVYTSHMAASSASAFPPMHDHAATEIMLRESGIAWTALRHGFYSASALAFMGDALKSGKVVAPADGKVSWTAHSDLAEVAALILAGERNNDGPTPPLTGSEALDLADLAGLASELRGHSVTRDVVPDEDLRLKMAARGAPPRAADIVLGFYKASRSGVFKAVDATLETLLGRPPITMREIIAERIRAVSQKDGEL